MTIIIEYTNDALVNNKNALKAKHKVHTLHTPTTLFSLNSLSSWAALSMSRPKFLLKKQEALTK